MFDYVDFYRTNPLRPPEWRWRLAEWLIDNHLRLHRSTNDNQLALTRRFILQLGVCRTSMEIIYLERDFPELLPAWSYFARDPYAALRYELEARLLAGQSSEAIHTRTTLQVPVIELYAAVFFDVADRRSYSGCVHQLIQARAGQKSVDMTRDVVWKLLAYQLGPWIVDWLTLAVPPTAPISAGDLQTAARGQLLQRTFCRALITACSPETSPLELAQCTQNVFRLLEQIERAGVNDADDMKAGIQALLESLPWTRSAAKAREYGLIFDLEKTGVGLRADEQLLVAAGQTPPGLKEIIASAVYPERVRKTTISS
jgi:hypothetical protein